VRPSSKKPPSSYELIWETVSKIPKGKVATYGQVAELSGLPGQARLVGYAMHNLPRGSKVPWHRVINAQGGISVSDLDGLYEKQIRLLKKEGVKFIRDKVNLYRYGWMKKVPMPVH